MRSKLNRGLWLGLMFLMGFVANTHGAAPVAFGLQDDEAAQLPTHWLGISSAEINSVLQSGRGLNPRLMEIRKWKFEEDRRLFALVEAGQSDADTFSRLTRHLETEFLQQHSAVVGPDQLVQAVQQAMLNRLASYVKQGDGRGDVAFLNHDVLERHLELDADQRERIKKQR